MHKKRYLMVGALVLVLGLMVWAPKAEAYNLLGGRWRFQPGSGCCAYFYLYYYSMSAADRQAFDNGRSAWTGSAANVFWYTTTSSQTIVAEETTNSSVGWDGITNLVPCPSCQYQDAASELNYYYTQYESILERQGVAAHELGHVMGLDHNTGCYLMTPTTYQRYTQCGINGPTTDDVNGVNALY